MFNTSKFKLAPRERRETTFVCAKCSVNVTVSDSKFKKLKRMLCSVCRHLPKPIVPVAVSTIVIDNPSRARSLDKCEFCTLTASKQLREHRLCPDHYIEALEHGAGIEAINFKNFLYLRDMEHGDAVLLDCFKYYSVPHGKVLFKSTIQKYYCVKPGPVRGCTRRQL